MRRRNGLITSADFWETGSAEGTVLEHQAAFVNALRSGREMQKRIFDTIEKKHAHQFADGRGGHAVRNTPWGTA
jgi:hypothetical protein